MNLTGHRAFVYVVYEHQSTVVQLMAFRLLVYMVRIWEAHLKDNPDAKRLPAIVPLVLHHSQTGWTAKVTFEDLLDVDPETLMDLGEHVVRFRFLLDDISHETDEHLKGRAMTALGRLVLWCLRSSRTPDELLTDIDRWTNVVREAHQAPSGMAALKVVWRYILLLSDRHRPKDVMTLLARAVGEDMKEEIMTAGEYLIEQGVQKGMEKGRTESLKAMLLKQLGLRFGSVPEAAVAQVSTAGVDRLELWIERIISAPSLADVLADPSTPDR